jgi:site-specific recombinase XerD
MTDGTAATPQAGRTASPRLPLWVLSLDWELRRGRQVVQYLVVERGLAANTVESYDRDLRRYASFLSGRGKQALADVTELDVAEFRAALRTGDDEHPPLAVSSVGRAVPALPQAELLA